MIGFSWDHKIQRFIGSFMVLLFLTVQSNQLCFASHTKQFDSADSNLMVALPGGTLFNYSSAITMMQKNVISNTSSFDINFTGEEHFLENREEDDLNLNADERKYLKKLTNEVTATLDYILQLNTPNYSGKYSFQIIVTDHNFSGLPSLVTDKNNQTHVVYIQRSALNEDWIDYHLFVLISHLLMDIYPSKEQLKKDQTFMEFLTATEQFFTGTQNIKGSAGIQEVAKNAVEKKLDEISQQHQKSFHEALGRLFKGYSEIRQFELTSEELLASPELTRYHNNVGIRKEILDQKPGFHGLYLFYRLLANPSEENQKELLSYHNFEISINSFFSAFRGRIRTATNEKFEKKIYRTSANEVTDGEIFNFKAEVNREDVITLEGEDSVDELTKGILEATMHYYYHWTGNSALTIDLGLVETEFSQGIPLMEFSLRDNRLFLVLDRQLLTKESLLMTLFMIIYEIDQKIVPDASDQNYVLFDLFFDLRFRELFSDLVEWNFDELKNELQKETATEEVVDLFLKLLEPEVKENADEAMKVLRMLREQMFKKTQEVIEVKPVSLKNKRNPSEDDNVLEKAYNEFIFKGIEPQKSFWSNERKKKANKYLNMTFDEFDTLVQKPWEVIQEKTGARKSYGETLKDTEAYMNHLAVIAPNKAKRWRDLSYAERAESVALEEKIVKQKGILLFHYLAKTYLAGTYDATFSTIAKFYIYFAGDAFAFEDYLRELTLVSYDILKEKKGVGLNLFYKADGELLNIKPENLKKMLERLMENGTFNKLSRGQQVVFYRGILEVWFRNYSNRSLINIDFLLELLAWEATNTPEKLIDFIYSQKNVFNVFLEMNANKVQRFVSAETNAKDDSIFFRAA